jgi:hypothetical protein
MPRPIMFSIAFPPYHPRAGQPTYFVEKIHKFILDSGQNIHIPIVPEYITDDSEQVESQALIFPKSHTIRRGHRWSQNEYFSPRFWSGPPYRSRQILIAQDLQIMKIWNILILPNFEVFLDGRQYGFYGSPEIETLAYHDGLSMEDFQNWFNDLPFDGQIICWNHALEYLH